jgi:hypothetical protein
MNQHKIPAALFSVLLGAALAGCDEKIAEKKSTDVKSDGTKVERTETVTEKADGTIEHKTSKEVDKPDKDVDIDKEVEVKVDK